jgi:ribosomal protein S2
MLLIPINDGATKSTIIYTEVFSNMVLRLSCSIKCYNDWE